ncbi:MAG: hypothetical protein K0Q59_2426 [Paenibacillus sp.]|jgi:hypothetical protein|nr:hypothetical protein [Paenibacillus sp.]
MMQVRSSRFKTFAATVDRSPGANAIIGSLYGNDVQLRGSNPYSLAALL